MLFKEEGLSSFFSFSAPPSQGWGEEAPQPPPWPLSLWSDVSCRRGSWWLLIVFPSCEEGSWKQLFQQPKQPLGGGGRWNCGSSAPNGSSSAGCCHPTTEWLRRGPRSVIWPRPCVTVSSSASFSTISCLKPSTFGKSICAPKCHRWVDGGREKRYLDSRGTDPSVLRKRGQNRSSPETYQVPKARLVTVATENVVRWKWVNVWLCKPVILPTYEYKWSEMEVPGSKKRIIEWYNLICATRISELWYFQWNVS